MYVCLYVRINTGIFVYIYVCMYECILFDCYMNRVYEFLYCTIESDVALLLHAALLIHRIHIPIIFAPYLIT